MKFAVFGICIAIFLLAPYIPNGILQATVNSYLGVIVLLGLVLYSLRVDPVISLAVVLTVGALFLENRKRIVAKIDGSNNTIVMPKVRPASVSALSEPAPDLVDGEVHPAHETPSEDEVRFEPARDSGSDKFESVGDSINEKVVLEQVPSSSSQAAAQFMTRIGLAN